MKDAEVALAEKLLLDLPGHAEALVTVGNMYHRRGDSIQGREHQMQALQISPRRADIYASMGWASLKGGDLEQAVKDYGQALAIAPESPEIRMNLGRAMIMLGRPAEAITVLKEETRLSPRSGFTHFLLGQAHGQVQDYTSARQSYEAALQIDPGQANAVYGLATVCARLGDADKAREYSETFKRLKAEERARLRDNKTQYDDYAAVQKTVAMTWMNSAKLYRSKGALPQAETLLKQAIGLDPNNVMGYLELGALYQAAREPDKALELFKKMRDLQPNAALSYLMIGMLSAQTKLWDDAEDAFETYIRLAPNTSQGYRQLARLYLINQKQLVLAKQLAGKALALEASAANYFVWGWACDSAGDTVNALPAVERALALDPRNQEYRRLLQAIQRRN